MDDDYVWTGNNTNRGWQRIPKELIKQLDKQNEP